jgi:hypothetical protein
MFDFFRVGMHERPPPSVLEYPDQDHREAVSIPHVNGGTRMQAREFSITPMQLTEIMHPHYTAEPCPAAEPGIEIRHPPRQPFSQPREQYRGGPLLDEQIGAMPMPIPTTCSVMKGSGR